MSLDIPSTYTAQIKTAFKVRTCGFEFQQFRIIVVNTGYFLLC